MFQNRSKKKVIMFGISMILDCMVLFYAFVFSPVGMKVRGIAAGIVLAAMIFEILNFRKGAVSDNKEKGSKTASYLHEKKIA